MDTLLICLVIILIYISYTNKETLMGGYNSDYYKYTYYYPLDRYMWYCNPQKY